MPNEYARVLSELIKEIETTPGFSRELAVKSRYAAADLSRYRNGKRDVRTSTLQAFVERILKECPNIPILLTIKKLGLDPAFFGLRGGITTKTSEVKQLWKASLRGILISEISKQLLNVDIFFPNSHDVICKQLISTDNPFGRRIKNCGALATNTPLLIPGSSEYSGIMDKSCKRFMGNNKRTVTISFPGYFLATAAIFFYLRDRKSYTWLDLDYIAFTAVEVVERIEKKKIEPPNVIILGSGPAVRILETNPAYEFHMFMPRIEQRIVASKVEGYNYQPSALQEGIYSFLTHPLSTNVFEFEAYTDLGKINKTRVRTEDNAPHDAIAKLITSDDIDRRYILCAPYWEFLQNQNLCEVLDSTDKTGFQVESMLFLNKSFTLENRLATALLIEIRNAWIVLRDQDRMHELEHTVEAMLADQEYVTVLERSWGLHLL